MYSGELRKNIDILVCHSNTRIPIPMLFQIFGESFRKKGGEEEEGTSGRCTFHFLFL